MPPRTKKPAIAAIPETEQDAARKEAEAAGQQLTWGEWQAQARKLHGRDFTTLQSEKLFDDYHKGLGPLIAIGGFPNEDDLDPWIRGVEKLLGREIEEQAECDLANSLFDAGTSVQDAAARITAAPASVPAKAPEASGPAIVAEQWIPRGDIKPSPDNPRQYFDQAKLEQLAGSLKKHKQLQPILGFRHADRGLEIIDGERRWRASGIAKLPQVLVRILDVTEEEAIELRGIANLERDDLNAIEEALWMQQLIDKCGYTQGSLAKKLGCDQSHVSHQLGLLKLSEEWRQAIMTREIAPSLARLVLPWEKRAAIQEKALAAFRKQVKENHEPPSMRDFKQIVHSAIQDCSKPLGQWDCNFTVTDKNREQLDIQEVPFLHGGGKERRAFNVTYWKVLEAVGKKRKQARDAKQATPAAASRGKARMAEHQVHRAVERWCGVRIATLAAKLLKDPAMRLRLFIILNSELHLPEHEGSTWDYLAKLDKAALDGVIRDSVQAEIGGWDNEHIGLGAREMIQLAAVVGVNYSEEWRPTLEQVQSYDLSFLQEAAKAAGMALGKGVAEGPNWRAGLVEAWPAGYFLPGFSPEDLR